ncbi:MAG: aldehyde dehydrogenase EutE [Bellilinea sp.]|jgi:propionaldehyde dehydrogenase
MTLPIQEDQLDKIVQAVMFELREKAMPRSVQFRGIFPSPSQAVEAALISFQKFRRISIAQRKAIIQAVREKIIENAQSLAQMAVEETHIGRVSDKVLKNLLVAEKTPGIEILQDSAYVGDNGLTLEEFAPFGVILAITPVTNPTATIVNNAISMIAAGNSVVFAPHPSARVVSLATIDLINEAIELTGGPANVITACEQASIEVVQELLTQSKIALVVATGGKAVVDAALKSGKRAIGAAAGNPPVLVDDSADPVKASRDIVLGHSFDNNLPCTSEKEAIVTSGIADSLLACFRVADNSLVLEPSDLPRLEKVILNEKRSGVNPKFIGRNANVILKELGYQANDELRSIIVETDPNHPFVRLEMMLPVLPFVRVRSFEEAVEVAVTVEAGLRHSAIIHSSNIYHMSEFARAINTTLFTKNAPSYAGLGFGGEGYTSFTIAGRTGEGMTTARTFSRIRRCTLVGAFSAV